MGRLGQFIKEGRRRRVFRVAALYVVAAWVIVQVADAAFPGWDIPESAIRFVWYGVFLGFPVALIFGWMYDVAPTGLVRTHPARSEKDYKDAFKLHRSDYLILAALTLIAGTVTFNLGQRILESPVEIAQPTVERLPPVRSIAVLPFANVGNDPENEYFSDGLSEELLNTLADVRGLRVAARTSSFSFKGTNEDIRAIAKKLNVASVLEGSVRRDGARVRISAQLIDAEQGYELWSDQYDSQMQDIFALQDEIAESIVAELLPSLEMRAQPAVLTSRANVTADMAAYELLLRGRYFLEQRDEDSLRRSIELFQEAIALDRSFGRIYVELARARVLLPYYSYELEDDMFDLAMEAIEQGAQYDDAVRASSQDILAFINLKRWNWVEAAAQFQRALASNPNDATAAQWYSQLLASVGHLDQALEYALRAKELDPISPVVNDRLGVVYLWLDQDELARMQFDIAAELWPGGHPNLETTALLLIREKNFDEARPILVGLQKMFANPTDWIDPIIAFLQEPAVKPAALAAIEKVANDGRISLLYLLAVWTYLGEGERAIDAAMKLIRSHEAFIPEFLFSPETRIIRANPRFAELITALNFEDYWERYGWPEACAPNDELITCH